jgi:predicted CopG family antitoxin
MVNITTIQLTKDTREKLLEIGKKKETYDDLINRLIEFYVDKERN